MYNFLGIEIDTKQMCKRLPNERMQALKVELDYFAKRKSANKKQLQSLAGKLNWAAGVIYGGRVFLRQILDAIRPHHKYVISPAIRLDIQWWTNFMSIFNGCSLILDALPATSLSTDACDVGTGAYYEGEWFYCNLSADCPELENEHINLKELAAVVLAIQRWAPLWANKRVFVWSDNTSTVSSINRCSPRSPKLMKCLRYVFGLSAIYNFRMTASYIPGIQNSLVDIQATRAILRALSARHPCCIAVELAHVLE